MINSHLNDVVIGKGKEMLCSIEDDFTEKLNIASIVVIFKPNATVILNLWLKRNMQRILLLLGLNLCLNRVIN